MAKNEDLTPTPSHERAQLRCSTTSLSLSLFSIVGIALYGLPFFYDFMVRDFGWSRAQVTSGNALSNKKNLSSARSSASRPDVSIASGRVAS